MEGGNRMTVLWQVMKKQYKREIRKKEKSAKKS